MPSCGGPPAHRLAEVRASARRLADKITGLRVRHHPDGPPALDGVSLRLPPGRRGVLVGASGSGKSTLIAALMRFLPYEAGSIRVGGHEMRELRDCAGTDARRAITGMTQDAHVFQTTIHANLLLARPDACEAELREAARRARILDWIESPPDRWDTFIGGDGATMSGGQRQRLLLTRALLADTPVLVLDEPTEGLDPDTAAAAELTDWSALLMTPTATEVTHVTPRGCWCGASPVSLFPHAFPAQNLSRGSASSRSRRSTEARPGPRPAPQQPPPYPIRQDFVVRCP